MLDPVESQTEYRARNSSVSCDPIEFPSAARRCLLDFRAPPRASIGAKVDTRDTFSDGAKWCGG